MEFAELAQRFDAMERRLDHLYELGSLRHYRGTAREVRALLADPKYGAPGRLERFGRKVWSQNDEDGILEEIFRRIGTASRSFVEFGVSHRECNTLKLLVEGWSGLWMESVPQECEAIRRAHAGPLAEGRLELLQTAVNAENIERLIGGARVAAAGELDLLSIDIDGNDYHVLKALSAAVRPRVLVIEYNGKFPPPMDLVPKYEPERRWDGSDYAGSSLQAIANLARRRGYRLVATNIIGVNAFFVRDELAGDRFAAADVAALYNPPQFWLSPGLVSGHVPAGRYDYATDAALGDPLRSK